MTDRDRLSPAEAAPETPVSPAAAEQAPLAGEPAQGEPQATKKPRAASRRKTAKEAAPSKAAKGASGKASAKKKPAPQGDAEPQTPEAPVAEEPVASGAPAGEAEAAPAQAEPAAAPAARPKRTHKSRSKAKQSAASDEPAPQAEQPAAAPEPAAQVELTSEHRAAPAPADEAPVAPAEAAPVPADTPAPAAEAPAQAAPTAPFGRKPLPRTLPRPVDEMGIDELIELFPPARRGRPNKREAMARKAREALLAARENPTPELLLAARAAVVNAVGDHAGPRADAPRPAGAEQAEAPVAPEAAGDSGAQDVDGAYGQRRRHHDRRGERDGKPDRRDQKQQGGDQSYQRDRDFKRDRDAQQAGGQGFQQRQRDGKYGQQGFSAQGRDDRFGKNARKARREFVNEPKVSREELEELKVSDLRTKASELGIESAGLKKSELVDAVYAGLFKQEGFFEFEGVLELASEGHGHVRTKGYLPSEADIYVGANAVRANALRRGDYICGIAHVGRPGDKYPGVTKLVSVNGKDPEEARNRPRFGDLTPVFPSEPLKMEHGKDSILGRCIDLVSPVGKGQRGLIVSPPKAGKTTVLKKIAESIAANNPEVHLICLLVDERPEEVTDMQRSIRGEVVASTFDMPCDNHIAVAELVIERAKRLVEQGGDVVILLDSITRLARAYNLAQPASGRILSGGVDSTALYPPKRFLGAARNIENGGSLTILASALVDTGSKMDEVIFEEFKGTGNMELRLDRDLADRRIFPAIDPVTSGTRKEELLLDADLAPFVWGVRRILANMNNNERAMSMLIKSLKATQNNEEFLIRSARKAQQQEMNVEL